MFLSGVSTITIQRVGRWSSEAFLEYIREQVESFTLGVSQKMLSYEFFHNLGTSANTGLANIGVASTDYNENGPVTVPFQVEFSNLVLNANE